MYFYIPNHRYGNDKIALIVWSDFQPWAIYEIDGEWGVCVGEVVAFSELIKPYRRDGTPPESMHLVFDKVLSDKSMELLYRFVDHRFTTYYKSLPLWLGDPDQLVKRRKQGRKKKGGSRSMIEVGNQKLEIRSQDPQQSEGRKPEIGNGSNIRTNDPTSSVGEPRSDTKPGIQKLQYDPNKPSPGQTLIVFPTVWSMNQYLKWWLIDLPGSLVLHGQLTATSRAKAYRAIQSWAIHTVYATYSQIFRDWKSLHQIILIDQHARRYKNFQDPRYFLPTVIEKIQEIWGCEIVKSGEVVEAS